MNPREKFMEILRNLGALWPTKSVDYLKRSLVGWWREWTIYLRHVLALFVPGSAAPVHDADKNVAGNLAGWTSGDLRLLVEEGRRQLDRQNDDLERVRGRSQVLLILGLALGGTAGSLRGIVSTADHCALWILWGVALGVIALAILGAAATAVVRADMETIHAAVLSRRPPGILRGLAADYSAIVMTGEKQIATRLTNLRLAVTLLLIGAAMTLGTWLWADAAPHRAPLRSPVACSATVPPLTERPLVSICGRRVVGIPQPFLYSQQRALVSVIAHSRDV